jgi:hypothetical protein
LKRFHSGDFEEMLASEKWFHSIDVDNRLQIKDPKPFLVTHTHFTQRTSHDFCSVRLFIYFRILWGRGADRTVREDLGLFPKAKAKAKAKANTKEPSP